MADPTQTRSHASRNFPGYPFIGVTMYRPPQPDLAFLDLSSRRSRIAWKLYQAAIFGVFMLPWWSQGTLDFFISGLIMGFAITLGMTVLTSGIIGLIARSGSSAGSKALEPAGRRRDGRPPDSRYWQNSPPLPKEHARRFECRD